MANEITFTDWKKGDILTAERLNNIQSVVQKTGKALGIFNDDNNTSNSIEFSGAGAKIGSVSMDAHGLTVGNSNGTYTTTLYGTLQTDTISGITNSNVNIGNLIVGKYENNAYTGTAIFNIAKVEFKNNVEVDNDIILTGKIDASSRDVWSIFSKAKINDLEVKNLTVSEDLPLYLTVPLVVDNQEISPSDPIIFRVGHPTINTQTNSITQYNGEAIFATAKTIFYGQTVIDSTIDTDLTDLLTVGHTSGSGTNTQYYGRAVFNTSQTEFHDIVSSGHISVVNENGTISSRNVAFGWQDTNVDNPDPYYGTATFRTNENIFFNGLKAYNTLKFAIDELTGEPYDDSTATFGGETTIYNLKVINDMTIGNVKFPEYPTTEGNYILKLNVAANGTKTLTWVSEANN